MSGATGVPDLLSLARLSRANHDLKRQLQDAQTEVITGEAADKVAATNGDPLRLLALDNEIATIDSRLPLISLAKSRAGAAQTALENAQEAVGDFATRLLGFATADDAISARAVAKDAKTILAQVLSALNTQVSGRHVFGGDDAESAPMADADTLLSDVRRLIDADQSDPILGVDGQPLRIYEDDDSDPLTPLQPRAATVDERLAHYFGMAVNGVEPPPVYDGDLVDPLLAAENEGTIVSPARARFGTATDADYSDLSDRRVVYSGGRNGAPPVELSAGSELDYSVQGDDPALRSLAMNLAIAAVSADEADAAVMMTNLEVAATGVIGATDQVTQLRTRLGQDEARIENAEARAQAERSSFVLARNALVGRDPYDAATRITELETQLQSVYAMTARLSNLSLLNFLR